MPTSTYDLLASTVLNSNTSSVTFSSISSSYRDLCLVITGARTTTTGFASLRFNGDSTNSYYMTLMRGDGTTASANRTSGTTEGNLYIDGWTTGAISTGQTLTIFNILEYSVTNKHKLILQRFNRSDGTVNAQGARWANNAAIDSIEAIGSTWASGTSFYLYGIVS